MSKTVMCKICYLQDHTDNRDLDSSIHEGFTIGKKGKVMFFMMIWHGTSGNVTVYPIDEKKYPRYISGDTMVTIHWKELPLTL